MIIKSPDSAAFAVGDKVRLTCNVKNEAEEIRKDLTYQWYKDGSAVIDKTQQDIELSPLKLSDAGMYYCKVTCNKLGDSSDPVNVAINRELSACSLINVFDVQLQGYTSVALPFA